MNLYESTQVFLPSQQPKDYSRIIFIVNVVGILLTPVMFFFLWVISWVVPASFVRFPPISFLLCFVFVGWIFYFEGGLSLLIGCLLLANPLTVRQLTQKTLANHLWLASTPKKLAVRTLWTAFAHYSFDILLSLLLVNAFSTTHLFSSSLGIPGTPLLTPFLTMLIFILLMGITGITGLWVGPSLTWRLMDRSYQS